MQQGVHIMKVDFDNTFNIIDNVTNPATRKIQEVVNSSADDVNNVFPNDTFENWQDDKKAKTKTKTTLREKTANVWKFFASANKMIKATVKGLFYGAATAAAFLGGSWLFKTLPKAFAKEGPKFKEIIRHPIKNIAKSGKVMAGIAGTGTFAYHIIKGKLQTNQRTADIDHQLKTGHRK